jgi:hypothetical protein
MIISLIDGWSSIYMLKKLLLFYGDDVLPQVWFSYVTFWWKAGVR